MTTNSKNEPSTANSLVEKDIIQAFLKSKIAICILRGNNYIIEFANDFYLEIHNEDQSIIGKPLFESGAKLISKSKDFLDKIMQEKATHYVYEKSFYLAKNGIKKELFFNCEFQPILETNTTIVGLIVMLTEVTDLVLAKKNHKVIHKNLTTELVIADKELHFQNKEKEKREAEKIALQAHAYALKVTSQYARSLIEACNDPMITINFDGKIMDMNLAMLEATGKSFKVILSTDFYLYFTEKQKAKDICKQIFRDGWIKNYPLTLKNNHLTDVLFNGAVYKDESGTIIGAVLGDEM